MELFFLIQYCWLGVSLVCLYYYIKVIRNLMQKLYLWSPSWICWAIRKFIRISDTFEISPWGSMFLYITFGIRTSWHVTYRTEHLIPKEVLVRDYVVRDFVLLFCFTFVIVSCENLSNLYSYYKFGNITSFRSFSLSARYPEDMT